MPLIVDAMAFFNFGFELVSVGGCFDFEERSCRRCGLDGGKRTDRRLVCIVLDSGEAYIRMFFVYYL